MAFTFTPYEEHVMLDAEVLRTKNSIISKIIDRFALLADDYAMQAATISGLTAFAPKISKGEKYQGLPYVVLDYPRIFLKEDILAIRSLFWWGNFFSITLHISGEYLQQHRLVIIEGVQSGLLQGWYMGINKDPWQHHFEEDNYVPITIDAANILKHCIHIKLAKKIPLKEWDNAEIFFRKNFALLLQLLAS